MGKYRLLFLPDQIETMVEPGTSILEAAGEAGVELAGPCGGKGTCGKCRVQLRDEKGSGPWVLACRTPVDRDLAVGIPQFEVSLHRKEEIFQAELEVKVDPGISKTVCKVAAPFLENQDSDAARLREALGTPDLSVKLEALRALPRVLREKTGLITAVIAHDQVLMVEPGDTSARLYGVAVDIGTTTIAAALVNLLEGETLAMAAAGNPQCTFGADVIARVEYVMQSPGGLDTLNRRVIQAINRLIGNLARDRKISPQEIYQMSVVGNTTMSHLFLKLDPACLASSPFIPVISAPVRVEAKELGMLISPHAPVYVAPNIAGFVGGDTVGVIIATEIYRKPGIYLVVDIGTNGEIVLAHDGELISCSAAAGPAFEGAQIQSGMRAAAGAIEAVVMEDDVELKVIGREDPKGICGSGLMDAVSELVRLGLLESSGRMVTREQAAYFPPALRSRLSNNGAGAYFLLVRGRKPGGEDLLLTQKDIRAVQLAKAALRAGIEVLLDQAGLTYRDLDEVLLAGAFGSYLNKNSALRIGLLPPVPAEKIRSIGNAAGAGATKALVSQAVRTEAEAVARRVRHVELSGRKDFQEHFMNFLQF